MNNVTYLHTIYINYQQRAVFDGTLEGLRAKLAQFGINASDLFKIISLIWMKWLATLQKATFKE